MARRGSRAGGRGTSNSSNRRLPRPSDFDDTWLNDFRERGGQFADLTDFQDLRRWSPSSQWPSRPAPRGLVSQPRIVIVPEGHKLARLQTYGGRYSYNRIRYGKYVKSKNVVRSYSRTWAKTIDPIYGSDRVTYERLPHRVGFTLPWQVIICVRRKQRRSVFHALKLAGRRGFGKGKPRRTNHYSEVRC